MSQNPYVQFYTSDFLGGTSGMTAACKGVYITLLCQMYEAERPLGQSWDMLARRCGCTLPAFKRAISDLVDDGKITITDDGIWSPKCEKHIALRRERQNSASSAAKKRWEKTQQKQDAGNADGVKAQCQPEPEPEPYIKQDTNVSLSVSTETTHHANDLSQAVSRYNDAAAKAGWPQVQKLTPNRSKQLRSRLKDCGGMDGWETALRKAFASDFCRGRTPKPWAGFGFDWLVKASNFTKLMEGNYDNRTDNPTAGAGAFRQQPTSLASLVARRRSEQR